MIDFTGKEAIVFKRRYLVISDLHIGYEYELYKKGINIPSQIEKTISKILDLREKFDTEKLIILGDLKHKVPGISYQELKDVPYFFQKISENFKKVYVTKGNHDGKIEEMVPEEVKNVKIVRELRIGKFCFEHGHRKPKFKCRFYFIGHNHPVVSIETHTGEKIFEKVFVLGKTEKCNVLIFPSFSTLITGSEISDFHGPIAKRIKEYFILSLEGYLLKEVKT